MARPTYAEANAQSGAQDDLLATLVSGRTKQEQPWSMPVEPPVKDTADEPGTSVPVDSVSTPVAAANPDRAELTLVNDSDTVIYVRLAATGAVLNAGIRLNANGGSYTTTSYRGAVCAIQSDTLADKRLLVTEV